MNYSVYCTLYFLARRLQQKNELFLLALSVMLFALDLVQ